MTGEKPRSGAAAGPQVKPLSDAEAPATATAQGDADFAVLLLMALSSMAARSKRRQADLVAALRGAGLSAEPRRVRAALRLLQAQGAIENLVPLSDGGLLLSVTPSASEQYGTLSEWLPRDGGDEPEA